MLILIGILSFSKAKGKGLMQKFTLKKSLYRNQMIMGYVLILPAVIFFAVFFAYSLIQAVRYSTLALFYFIRF